jgi:hypothetical protein
MKNPEIKSLPIAVRVFPAPVYTEENARSKKSWQQPEGMLVIHTEGTDDAARKLFLGSARFMIAGQCVEECLFHGVLGKTALRSLKKYVERHPAETGAGGVKQLRLLNLREFNKAFYDLAYKARCLVVGSNLPFQLPRLAFYSASARGFFAGGFSLGLWTYRDKKGRERLNSYRPRLCIKYIDNKRAFIGFTARNSPEKSDLVPEGSTTGEPKPGYIFPGHFLDLRTLAFALTDEVYSLEGACEAFGIDYEKDSVLFQNVITKDYIHAIRRTVAASSELAVKLLDELAKHPIDLPPTQAFSPASIGKAYLRATGIETTL